MDKVERVARAWEALVLGHNLPLAPEVDEMRDAIAEAWDNEAWDNIKLDRKDAVVKAANAYVASTRSTNEPDLPVLQIRYTYDDASTRLNPAHALTDLIAALDAQEKSGG